MHVSHKSFYKINNRHTKLSYTGTKHRGKLLNKTLSKYFQTNPVSNYLLSVLEPILTILFDGVRDVKKFKNQMIHKNFYDFN